MKAPYLARMFVLFVLVRELVDDLKTGSDLYIVSQYIAT